MENRWAHWSCMSSETPAIVADTSYLDVDEKTAAKGRKMLCLSRLNCNHLFWECLCCLCFFYSNSICHICHSVCYILHQKYTEDQKRHGFSPMADIHLHDYLADILKYGSTLDNSSLCSTILCVTGHLASLVSTHWRQLVSPPHPVIVTTRNTVFNWPVKNNWCWIK